MTDFDTKCEILSEVWTTLSDNDDLQDFFQVHDLGLPLAYLYVNGHIVDVTGSGIEFIDQTFQALLDIYGAEDNGISNLEDIIA